MHPCFCAGRHAPLVLLPKHDMEPSLSYPFMQIFWTSVSRALPLRVLLPPESSMGSKLGKVHSKSPPVQGDGTVSYVDPFSAASAVEWFNAKEFKGDEYLLTLSYPCMSSNNQMCGHMMHTCNASHVKHTFSSARLVHSTETLLPELYRSSLMVTLELQLCFIQA